MFEEQSEKLLGQVESIIDEQHQHLVCQLVSELRAGARAALTSLFGFNDNRFALLLLLLKGLRELWQKGLKLMQIHSCDSQKLFRISTKYIGNQVILYLTFSACTAS